MLGGSANGQPITMNIEKIRARFGVVIEQAPYVAGVGGLASTESSSFAGARALLVLLALQTYPMLVRRFPDIAITVLAEAHPKDGVTGVAGAMAVRFEEDTSPAPADTPARRLRVWLPVRSATAALKLIEPSVIRSCLWRALTGATRVVRGEAAIAAAAAELEKEWRDTLSSKVPLDVAHLVWMGVIHEKWAEEYQKATGSAGAVAASQGAAVGLWWPPPASAITFAEMQRQRTDLREMRAEIKVAEAGEKREVIARAALLRVTGVTLASSSTSTSTSTPPKSVVVEKSSE